MIKEHILKTLTDGHRLDSITIEITNSCNLRCVHCYQKNRNSNESNKSDICFLDIAYIKKILEEIQPLGVITIGLTGGEVFTHPQFYEIIELIKKRKYNIALLSNITMVNEKNIHFLSERIGHISTSCYGLDAKSYESVTGIPGSFEKYTNAKRLIKSSKIRLQEKAIVMRQNFHQVEDLIKSTNTSGCEIYVNSENPYSNDAALSEEQAKRYWKYYFDHNNKEKTYLLTEKKECNHCLLCIDSLIIDVYGNILPCINFNNDEAILGNVKKDNICSVWNSDLNSKLELIYQRIKQSKCFECEFGIYHSICAANNYYQTKDIATPSHSSCIVCKSRYKVLKEIYDERE